MTLAEAHERIARLREQLAKIDGRKRQDSANSAVAKRRQKIARDIADIEKQVPALEKQDEERRRKLMLVALAAA